MNPPRGDGAAALRALRVALMLQRPP